MTLTLQQSMMLLAFAADTELTVLHDDEAADEIELYEALTTKVLPSINSGAGTNWKLVWGPWVKTEPYVKWKDYRPTLQRRIVNAMYVAQDGSNFVIGIAGTDFRSAYDWLVEDMNVWELVSWNSVAKKSDSPIKAMISKAAQTGINFLLNGAPKAQVPGKGTTIQNFLAKNVSKGSTLYTTGHSLGGSLSEVMALWISDQNATGNQVTILPYSYAGPTPGNDVFATYYASKLTLQRIWNEVDIVPNAWNSQQMLEYAEKLKLSQINNKGVYATGLVGAAMTMKSREYTQVANGIELASEFNPQYTEFLCQVYYQHIIAYYVLSELPVPDNVISGMPANCSAPGKF
jgi:hypothetical protein